MIIKELRKQVLENRDGDEHMKGGALLISEEQAQLCLRDFLVAMSQPKVLLLRFDATWLF